MNREGAVTASPEQRVAARDPMDVPDRAEVWIRAKLRNNSGEPDVQLVDDDGAILTGRIELGWSTSVWVEEPTRLLYGRERTHYADEPCTCPGTPHARAS